jgi:hypothetical protein
VYAGTPVRGGLTFREAHYLVEAVSESGYLGSLDMVLSHSIACPLAFFQLSLSPPSLSLCLVDVA